MLPPYTSETDNYPQRSSTMRAEALMPDLFSAEETSAPPGTSSATCKSRTPTLRKMYISRCAWP